MAQNETVGQMAAVIYAARVGVKSPTGNDRQTFCDDAANAAWDIYNAVQVASTEAAKRLTARYSQQKAGRHE
jgi:hypothetical protein